MISFAVWHEGMDEGQGSWVLAVDGNRLLLSGKDGSLYYRSIADCRLLKAQTPDNPIAVVPIQVQQQPGIVVPQNGFMKGLN